MNTVPMGRQGMQLVGVIVLTICCWAAGVHALAAPDGFRSIPWGSSLAQVQAGRTGGPLAAMAPDNSFPVELGMTRYRGNETVAGYPATVTYYFLNDSFFQATINFPFDNLRSYDFNYNVFRSVDGYYRVIHDQTLTFVYDIYALLNKKYGKKEPVFKGLDPRNVFKTTDLYLRQERWNMRYNPSEYYKRIVAAAYARWDFPKTRVLFSINISAADKRFDYNLSLTSLDLEQGVRQALDSLRMQGL